MRLEENKIIGGRYELIKRLGYGGYSEVWLAEDKQIEKKVVIKFYAAGSGLDNDGKNMFKDEFVKMFELNHTNLLKPVFFDITEDTPFLILPYCANGSCKNKIGNMSEDEIWQFIKDVSSGLSYLHSREQPIIHQDIKPDNILIDENGNYLISDFGISTRARATLRKSVDMKQSTGTLAYMAPERFSQQRDAIMASDIWSLGATIYELMEGDVPYSDQGGLLQKGGADFKGFYNEDSSKQLQNVVLACLNQEPWDRPKAEDLYEYACFALEGKLNKIVIKLPSEKEKKPSLFKFKKKHAFITAAILLIVAGGILLYMFKPEPKPIEPIPAVVSAYPIIIDSIDIANLDEDSLVYTEYGEDIYSINSMFLKPRITYTYGNPDKDTVVLNIKWFLNDKMYPEPTKSGYSYSDTIFKKSINPDSVTVQSFTAYLTSWGSAEAGSWDAGTARLEIWYNDTCLKAKSFEIHKGEVPKHLEELPDMIETPTF
ncbi:MAG: serine/threonine protein kinase [Bacteroidales bacterium]|nr:serine/threonine protein kinase [Bacteroidales bacterium]